MLEGADVDVLAGLEDRPFPSLGGWPTEQLRSARSRIPLRPARHRSLFLGVCSRDADAPAATLVAKRHPADREGGAATAHWAELVFDTPASAPARPAKAKAHAGQTVGFAEGSQHDGVGRQVAGKAFLGWKKAMKPRRRRATPSRIARNAPGAG